MKGRTFKRCPCAAEYDTRGRRKACSKRHGSWGYVVDVGRDPATGKRRQRTVGGFRTQAEADAELRDVLTDVQTGRYRDDGRRTVTDYLREWLNVKVAGGHVRVTTARSYRQHIETYLIPHLGHMRLRDLQPSHVSRMLRTIAREQRHPSAQDRANVTPSRARDPAVCAERRPA
jgi:hypothetical protein